MGKRHESDERAANTSVQPWKVVRMISAPSGIVGAVFSVASAFGAGFHLKTALLGAVTLIICAVAVLAYLKELRARALAAETAWRKEENRAREAIETAERQTDVASRALTEARGAKEQAAAAAAAAEQSRHQAEAHHLAAEATRHRQEQKDRDAAEAATRQSEADRLAATDARRRQEQDARDSVAAAKRQAEADRLTALMEPTPCVLAKRHRPDRMFQRYFVRSWTEWYPWRSEMRLIEKDRDRADCTCCGSCLPVDVPLPEPGIDETPQAYTQRTGIDILNKNVLHIPRDKEHEPADDPK